MTAMKYETPVKEVVAIHRYSCTNGSTTSTAPCADDNSTINMEHSSQSYSACEEFTRDVADRIGLNPQSQHCRPQSPAEVLNHATRLKKLNELVIALSQIHDVSEAYKVVALYTRDIIGSARVSVAMLQGCGTKLAVYGVDGVQGAMPTGIVLPLKGTMVGAVVQTQAPVRVMDCSQYLHWGDIKKLSSMGMQASINVPLIAAGKVIGTLNTGAKDPSIYFPEVEQLLIQVASVLASLLERDRLYKEACAAKQQAMEEKRNAIVASNAKTTFLSQMTHELRTPMNGVLGMTALLSQTSLDPKQREMVQTIQTSGDALLTTINDLLDYTKIEANKLELEKIPFSPPQCIRDTLTLVRFQAQEKGVELETEIAEDCPPLLVQDVTRVRQVLTNLVGNAIKFTSEGSIKVKVQRYEGEEESKEDETDTKPTDNTQQAQDKDTTTIHFSVQDTGIGIPASRQDSLFDSFSQVDASTTRKFGGSGLGLAISKRLTELMGGRVWVQSTVGVGSTFHFTIQAQTPPPCPKLKRQHSTDGQPLNKRFDSTLGERHPLKILLVEDVKVNQRVATMFLKKLGYTDVTVAENGLEAVKAESQQDFDLIFMDVHMPVMDGYEATQRIRSANPCVRIVAMTADAMIQEREKALGSGMDDFVAKPVRIDELTHALEKCTPLSQRPCSVWC